MLKLRKRKNFTGYCPKCNEVKKLTFVGENKELAIYWLRCNTCAETHYYPIKRIQKTGRVLTPDDLKSRTDPMSNVVEYSLDKTYWIGQRIHHSVFNDIGKIVKKRQTAGRHQVIIVRFDHNGTKELVEGFETSA